MENKDGYHLLKPPHTHTHVPLIHKHTLDKPQFVCTFTHRHTHNASSFSSLTIKTGMISDWGWKKNCQCGCSLRDLIGGEEEDEREDGMREEGEKRKENRGGHEDTKKGKEREGR